MTTIMAATDQSNRSSVGGGGGRLIQPLDETAAACGGSGGGGSVDASGTGPERRDKSKRSDVNASFLRAARAGNLEKVLYHLKNKIDINTSNANGMNALHLASKEGHVDVVSELLNQGADISAATKKGNTALHITSLAGHEEVVVILVESGAQVNVQSQNGFSPLYMAAQENHVGVVKFLLTSGANPSLATEDGFTPLAVALQQGHDKVVAILLENDTRGKVHLPALHIAAKKDDVKAAALLLQNEHNIDYLSKSGSLVNDTTKSGFTPLHIAAHYGNVNVAELLIDKGADISYKARNSITPLHVAAKWGRSNMVTLLLDHGANIDSRTRDGLTPLHCAARSGHDQAVDLLLERGAQVLAKTKNGLGPLHMSVQGDHVDCSRLLLYHKAPIDDVTVDYLTPLHVAAHCGNVKTAKLLLDRKCEVNARALNGFTPLHIACKKNRIKIVELLIKYGASIEATTESGLTSLHVVSFMGHMNIAILLIQHGGNPNTTTVRGETALHLAARANQLDIIRILIRNGAQVDAKAREQQTPLHIASRLGNVDIVSILLQHGASPDAVTRDLYTPIHLAAKEGHLEVVQLLLEHGANQTVTTKKGLSILHVAAKHGHVKVVELLIQKDVDPNMEGKSGLTPLHIAAHYNKVDVIRLLLENGACPQRTAKNGYTPLHIASKKKFVEAVKVLLDHKAQPNAESRNGYTALHLASLVGCTDVVSLLLERGADPNWHAKNGLTALHLAAQEDRVPVATELVKYGCHIDEMTKAGYTPLHTACHFGQINMIRFLLENSASVNTTTKLGYTPLHQAAQQGHLAVINLLLKYQASPNAVTHTGVTSLCIAQRLGYISVVEILKRITEVTVSPLAMEEKYKVIAPEMMQEATLSDSEDEGGDETLAGDQSFQYFTSDDMKILQDDSISLIKDDRDIYAYEKSSEHFSLTSSVQGMVTSSQQEDIVKYSKDESDTTISQSLQSSQLVEKVQMESIPRMFSSLPPGHGISPIKPSLSEADCQLYAPPSYAGPTFTSVSADNIIVVGQPAKSVGMLRWRSFLVSFMVDARGGAMHGCRYSGVRIIIPPGKACMPTRVTCKLIRLEKIINPPPMMEGEALASRILEIGPTGAKFLGPVIIEVPHFASLRGREREISILRSDNGQSWREHTIQATEEAVQEALNGGFQDIDSNEELHQKRITRILTMDFPQYFALMTRCRQESSFVGPDGGILSSTVIPQVQAVFPPGALMKNIRVGLQAQPVYPEVISRLLGNRVAVSPIITVEPRRRKFHKPITLTVPIPQASQKGMLNACSPESPTLHLLCSITGGTTPSQWEDITGTTPLSLVNDCVTFTTSVSARFWLMDCQSNNEAAKMATDLYNETITVPFMSKFMVFAKRHHDLLEAKIRVFCVTDDKIDKTLETKERFVEVARSRDVEVLEGKRQYVELAGNLIPVTKSGEELSVSFHAFRENRLPFLVRIRDINEDALGRMTIVSEPRATRGDATTLVPVCNLNITLPNKVNRARDMEPDEMSHSSKLMLRTSCLDSLKDSLMSSSSLESSYLRGGQSLEASFDERDLRRNSGSVADQSWSETGSVDSKDAEVEQHLLVVQDDLLTPVIEEKTPLTEEQRTPVGEESERTRMKQEQHEKVEEEEEEEHEELEEAEEEVDDVIVSSHLDEVEGMDDNTFSDEDDSSHSETKRKGVVASNIKAASEKSKEINVGKSFAEGGQNVTRSDHMTINRSFNRSDQPNTEMMSSDRNSNFDTTTTNSLQNRIDEKITTRTTVVQEKQTNFTPKI